MMRLASWLESTCAHASVPRSIIWQPLDTFQTAQSYRAKWDVLEMVSQSSWLAQAFQQLIVSLTLLKQRLLQEIFPISQITLSHTLRSACSPLFASLLFQFGVSGVPRIRRDPRTHIVIADWLLKVVCIIWSVYSIIHMHDNTQWRITVQHEISFALIWHVYWFTTQCFTVRAYALWLDHGVAITATYKGVLLINYIDTR